MRAWQVQAFGPYKEALSIAEVPEPDLSSDGVIIDVRASGVMYADLLNIAGQYQMKAPLPFVPGSEAAGLVLEAGSESRFKPGDRVVTVNMMGGFGEKTLGLNANTFAIPDEMPFTDAACFCINYQTAYMGMVYRGRLKAGETVLVQAGSSGVGTAAIQLAKAHGCTVIATASTDVKLEVCRKAGADHVINYAESDFVGAVKQLTGGRGADVVFDPVGGDAFDNSTKCIGFEGRIIVIGFASGRIPEVATNRLLLKNIDVIGVFFGNYNLMRNDFVHETLKTLMGFYHKGDILPIIYNEYRFEDLPRALEAIETRQCYGKPVLVMG